MLLFHIRESAEDELLRLTYAKAPTNRYAVDRLGESGIDSPEVVNRLMELLDDPDDEAGVAHAHGIGQIGAGSGGGSTAGKVSFHLHRWQCERSDR